MELKAYAKINLGLDVIRRRPDGYHEVKMIMQTLELCDDLSFEQGQDGSGIKLITNNEILNSEQEGGKDNLITKAVKKLETYTGRKFDVIIKLNKFIPLAAGMAGGSADAAAALRGVNRLFELGLDTDTLCSIGATIGADVPFCVRGGLTLCEGIGEVLTELNPLQKLPVLICKPDVSVSTPLVYKLYDELKSVEHPDVDAMVEGIKTYDYKKVVNLMGNVLENVTAPMHPVIADIEKSMAEAGALRAMMSGSGPTVFGIFESEKECIEAVSRLREIYPGFFVNATTFHNKARNHFE